MKFKITIPGNPISNNHYLTNTRSGRRYTPKKTKEYQNRLQDLLHKHSVKLEGILEVDMTYYFGDKRIRDMDNYSKVILDCMQGFIYENDNQIKDGHMHVRYDKENPRTEVVIWVQT
jgi:Holliday junction resolvase RusA-like endonuclease